MGNMNGNTEYNCPTDYEKKGSSKMAKGKSAAKKPLAGGGAKGGSGHMVGKQHVGTRKPGLTGKSDSSSGGRWGKGGPTGKVGSQAPSRPAKAGVSR